MLQFLQTLSANSGFISIASVLLCEVLGGLSMYFTGGYQSWSAWHEGLNHPSFRPPNWVFFPVWTFLYATMGLSLAAIINTENPYKSWMLYLFGAQLFLNIIWSPIFFRWRQTKAALGVLVGIWACVAGLIFLSWKTGLMYTLPWGENPKSIYVALILAPYLAWLSLAGLLNWKIVELNP